MRFKTFQILLLLILFVSSCNKTEDLPQLQTQTTNGVLILNEGNFGWGNAEIGWFDLDSKVYTENLYEKTNNQPLGDVLQSAMMVDNEIFLVLNNSGYIAVIDKETFKLKRTLQIQGSPRYMAKIPNLFQAYVTDIYSNTLTRIDLASGNKLAEITLDGWQEQIAPLNDSIYIIVNLTTNKTYLLNYHSNTLTDSLAFDGEIAGYSHPYILIRNGGGESNIFLINPDASKTLTLQHPERINRFCASPQGTIYYISDNKLYSHNPNTGNASKTADLLTTLPYNMFYHPSLNQIWISDALDYVRKGKVYVYDQNGTFRYDFTAGYIPRGFLVLRG